MIRNPVKLNRTNNYKKANLVILEDIQTVKCCVGENVVVAFFYLIPGKTQLSRVLWSEYFAQLLQI